MYELIYCSTATKNIKHEDISAILNDAKQFNTKHNITGCLLYFNKQFIQIIEGDRKVVEGLFSKISKDTRHEKIIVISKGDKDERAFSEWRMAYHELSNDEMAEIGKEIFVNNFLAFSDIAKKSTSSVLLFWALVKNILHS